MPNPPKSLSEKDLAEVETLAGLGMRFEDIALAKGMCLDTLKKYADEPLRRGKAKAKAQVMQTAYKMAVSGKAPAMTMFWLKTQAGWRETAPQGEERPTTGNPSDPARILADALARLQSGEMDPKLAAALATLSGAYLKAVEQGEIRDRLAALESSLKAQDPQPLELDL